MYKLSRMSCFFLIAAVIPAATLYGDLVSSPPSAPPTATAPATAPATQPLTLSATNPDPGRYMFEDELRPGMKGFGLTVMKGGKIEKFSIEVIDVMKNLGPRSNAILVKCSGLGLEHSGVIAGMSGSPVFVEGPEGSKEGPRMIGAIAFGWGASKDPIAGVQPIRQMLCINPNVEPTTQNAPSISPPNTPPGSTPLQGASRWSNAGNGLRVMAARKPAWNKVIKSFYPGQANGPVAPLTRSKNETVSQLQMPLVISGTSSQGVEFLSQLLTGTGLTPLASGTSGSAMADAQPLGGVAQIPEQQIKLEPGSAIAINLITGDLEASAIGTVTEVRDGRVYAFGHPMFADGPTSLPMATGYIYSVLPSLVQSFKMGTSYKEAGALVSDEQSGIMGKLGQKAALIPMSVRVESCQGAETYHYNLAQHAKLTPELLGVALKESLEARRQLPKQFTIRVSGEVKFATPAAAEKDAPLTSLKINNLSATESFSLTDTIIPLAILTDNPFESLPIRGVELKAKIEPVNHAAQIKTVQLRRATVAPGEELAATVEISEFQQPTRKMEIKLAVPANTPDGQYELAIGSNEMMLMQEVQYYPQRFMPGDIRALIKAVKHITSFEGDQLYARLILNADGVTQEGREMAHWPASRVAMYSSEKRTDATPLFNAAMSKVDANCVLSGGETFTITVAHDANHRFYSAKEQGSGKMPRQLPVPITGKSAPSSEPGSKEKDQPNEGNPFE